MRGAEDRVGCLERDSGLLGFSDCPKCATLVRKVGRWLRIAGLLGLVGTACAVATSAPAAADPVLFRLSVTGIAHHQWTFASAPVETGSCNRTETSEGIRTTRFHTVRPILVRWSGARVLPAGVRGIAGTVTLVGANTIDERCAGGVGSSQIADCAQTRRAFSGARTRVSSPRRGFVALAPTRPVRLAQADCPFEPAEVRRRPLGPLLSPLRMPKGALKIQRITRVNMQATRSQTTSYLSPEAGTLQERVEWRLTFVRVKS